MNMLVRRNRAGSNPLRVLTEVFPIRSAGQNRSELCPTAAHRVLSGCGVFHSAENPTGYLSYRPCHGAVNFAPLSGDTPKSTLIDSTTASAEECIMDESIVANKSGAKHETRYRGNQDLLREAEQSADAAKKATIREVFKTHKKAIFWSVVLSTALIMEGYDVVIVSLRAPRANMPS